MEPDNSYPVSGGQYGLDPPSLNESQWAMYQAQYGQQNEQFAPPQVVPPSTVTTQTYQPYSDPQLSYGNYGIPQETLYSVPSFSGGFAPSYQQSELLHPYVSTQRGTAQSQAHPQIQQSFQSGNQPYPYTQVFRADERTISPHVLERVDNIPQSQRSSQTWNQGVAAGYEHQNAINSTGQINQQMLSRPNAGDFTSPSVGGSGSSGRLGGISSQVRDVPRSAPSRKGTTILQPQSRVRITHPELLATTQNISSRRISSAPFIVLDEEPVALEGGVKTKTPVSKPVKDSSKRSLDTGSENTGTSVTPSMSYKKARARPLKSGPSMGLANTASKMKSLPSARDRSTQSSASSDEDSDSDDESSDEESVEADMLQELNDARGETRPSDVVQAAAWDAIGTIFSPKYRGTTTEEIIKGMQEFGKLFLNLRDELVSISTDLTNAETEKRLEDSKRLRDARALKRRVIASAVQAVIKFGKVTILINFGKNPKLINGFIHVLRDCVKFKELGDELPKAVLNLLSRCGFITDELLQKVKFEPLAKRFLMINDAEIKGYIKSIRANTIEAKERAKVAEQATKGEDAKVRLAAQETSKARKAEEALKPAPNSSSLKRPLETDANSGKPSKKIASEATAVGSSQKPAAPKPRAASFFDILKRPGLKAQVPTKAANTPAPVKKPDPKIEPTPIPKSSLAAILESIQKPKEVPKEPEAPPRPPETPEEKARRERKESRRHLRVHWKDGSALAEIRLFKHEQAEDEGRQDNMLRDAHDDRSEGMMLKQRVLENMADDEDDGAAEIEYMPYPELTLIDFSELDNSMREKSYVTQGGKLPIRTPQQQIQDRRESLELMVVYTDPKDIPPSPKEPPQALSDKAPAERTFGQPNSTWLAHRIQEIYQYGPAVALSRFVRRLEGQKGRPIYQDAARGTNTAPDISSILNAMKGLPQEQNLAAHQFAYQQHLANQQPATQNFTLPHKHQGSRPQSQVNTSTSGRSEQQMKMVNDVFANLARMTDHLRGKPYPPTEPPAWMTERAKSEWWEGYYRDNGTPAKLRAIEAEISAHHAQLRVAEAQIAQTPPTQVQSQASVPQMQYPQIGQYSVPPPPNIATGGAPAYDIGQLQQILAGLSNPVNNAIPPQLQNIFSGLNAQSTQAMPQQQNWPAGWPGASGATTTGQSYSSQPQLSRWDNPYTNVTDNGRSASNENSRSTYDTSNQDNGSVRTRDGGEDRHRVPTAASEYKGKKKPCKFWQEGKCAKGANCTFLHD